MIASIRKTLGGCRRGRVSQGYLQITNWTVRYGNPLSGTPACHTFACVRKAGGGGGLGGEENI